MASRKSSGGCGCLILIVITIGLFAEYPEYAWLGIGAIGVFGIVAIFSSGPSSCELCGTELRKTKYVWTIKDKKKTVCPNCNRRLENRKSKEAIDSLFDE